MKIVPARLKTAALARVAALSFVVFALVWLFVSGRRLTCACGTVLIWVGSAFSEHTSQHLFDPYSFSHILHGFVFCWLLRLVAPKLKLETRFWLAVVGEASWELLENSNLVIERYRQTTAALGYSGDSVLNSSSDIAMCALGFLIAARLGFWRSLLVFVVVETGLLLTIRDSLLLNVIMLVYPVEWLKAWQSSH